MPNLNYPFDQDLAFNSFIITDPTTVAGTLGRTYNQSELVPVSYPKIIAKSFVDASIKWLPLQETPFSRAQESILRQSDRRMYPSCGC